MPEPDAAPRPGRTVPLSLPRRWVGDLMAAAAGVPGVPVVRRMRLGPVARLRDRADPRPGWAAVFAKAFALTAAGVPAFRRAYLGGPRPRLYEAAASDASVAVEREYAGEPAVFFARLRTPERQPLAALDAALRHARTAPVEAVGEFRRLVRVTRLWRPVRRAGWWLALNASGRRRTRAFGTFGVTSYAALGAESLHPLSPLAFTLSYGVISAAGEVDVRVVYDHRVADGATVARGLARMEDVLHADIAGELAGLAARAAG